MNKDEIKRANSMTSVVERYGLRPNRAGFIQCPFHQGDRTASMKIYKDSFHCFGCGANGDIFTFVQKMNNCDFKTAFYLLGGNYEKPSFESKMAVYHAQKKQEMRKKEEQRSKNRRKLNNTLITVYRRWLEKSEPLTDVWCDCYNALQYQLYIHEIINEKRTEN